MVREVKVCVEKETEKGTVFRVLVPRESLTDEIRKFSGERVLKGELRIDDGRSVTEEKGVCHDKGHSRLYWICPGGGERAFKI